LLASGGFASRPAQADNPLLNRNGKPNALFWAAGAATIAFDKPLYDFAQRLDSPASHKAAVAFNNFGDGRVHAGALLLLTAAGGAPEKRIARRGLHGLVAGGLVVYALKNTTRKSRPWAGHGPRYGAAAEPGDASDVPGELDGHPDSNRSFPSGHTMAAFSLATVWAHERPRDRELAYALAALAGLARIQLKQHWPSDVFIGAALGTAAGNAASRDDVPFGLMFRVR
jgi:membrane-associated phospholipid phosphatase